MQELYKQYKGLLFTLAYQLTGSAADAEDAVQDVFVKACDGRLEQLDAPKAYLCKMVTNRCLDMLKSARRQRESYVGEWLPEPVSTSEDGPEQRVLRGELLSYAMLVLLERLSPGERAVFVLREALGFDYTAIAELVGKSETSCRKLMSRARSKMGIASDADTGVERASEQWLLRFLAALEQGSADAVMALLDESVVLISDGGGRVSAAAHPVETPARVAGFMLGLSRKLAPAAADFQIVTASLNGQEALVISSGGLVDTVLLLHAGNGAIRSLYLVRNPDKLKAVAL